jgi:hypothetical protein
VPVFGVVPGQQPDHDVSISTAIMTPNHLASDGSTHLGGRFRFAFGPPGKHRISGEQAMLFIGSTRERLSIITLTGDEYLDALAASPEVVGRLRTP